MSRDAWWPSGGFPDAGQMDLGEDAGGEVLERSEERNHSPLSIDQGEPREDGALAKSTAMAK